MLHAGLAGENHADGERQPGGVHRSVAAEVAAGLREAMSPGADAALAPRRLEGEAFQSGTHRVVARQHDVFAEEGHEVAVVPGQIAVRGEVRGPLCLRFQEREIIRVAAGEQGERVEGA